MITTSRLICLGNSSPRYHLVISNEYVKSGLVRGIKDLIQFRTHAELHTSVLVCTDYDECVLLVEETKRENVLKSVRVFEQIVLDHNPRHIVQAVTRFRSYCVGMPLDRPIVLLTSKSEFNVPVLYDYAKILGPVVTCDGEFSVFVEWRRETPMPSVLLDLLGIRVFWESSPSIGDDLIRLLR